MSEKSAPDTGKLLLTLGLARRAGKMIFGTNLICEALSRGACSDYSVFIASDASENTRKRLTDRCKYYEVKLFETGADGFALAKALGKSGSLAAVAVTDQNLSRAAEKYI